MRKEGINWHCRVCSHALPLASVDLSSDDRGIYEELVKFVMWIHRDDPRARAKWCVISKLLQYDVVHACLSALDYRIAALYSESGMQHVPRYRQFTKTALKVLERVSSNDAFRSLTRYEGPLEMDIANHVRYWILHQDLPLQSLAVTTISNLSLIKSERTAIARAGILDSITQVICSKKSKLDNADVTQLVLSCLTVVDRLLNFSSKNQADFVQSHADNLSLIRELGKNSTGDIRETAKVITALFADRSCQNDDVHCKSASTAEPAASDSNECTDAAAN